MTFSYWPQAKDRFNKYATEGMMLGSDEALPNIMWSRTWSVVVWDPEHRAKVNFKYADWLGLDFDNGPTLDEMTRALADTVCIIGTTRNHRKEKRGLTCDRFRVAIKLEHRCENLDDFEFTMKKLVTHYGADTSAMDGARLLYPCSKITTINLDERDNYKQPILKAPPRPPRVVTFSAGGRFYKSRLYRMVEMNPSLVQNRNTTLFKLGMELKDQGVDPNIIRSELMRLIPTQDDFTEKEKENVFKSVMRQTT